MAKKKKKMQWKPGMRGMKNPNEDKVWVCAAVDCGHLIRGNMNEPWQKLESGQHVHDSCQDKVISQIRGTT